SNANFTMIPTGGARGSVQCVLITETAPTPAANQIAVRTANNSAVAIDNYLVDSVSTAVSGTPAMANVAAGALSGYVAIASGKIAARVTPAGSATEIGM